MSSKGDAAMDEATYTVNGILDRLLQVTTYIEDSTGLSLNFTFILWVVLVSSLTTAFISYLLLRLARSGLDRIVFSKKFMRGLLNFMKTRKSFVSSVRGVVDYVKSEAEEGNPDMAMLAADQYAEKNPLMHIGETKGKILDGLIVDANPKVVLELGAYFGYSAVRMARLLKEKGAKVFSIEVNPGNADASRDFAKFAGMAERVTVVTGSAAEIIPQLKDRFGIDKVDFVLVDHWKGLYVSDLKILERSGLMRKGTVVAADNILFPGAPEYAEYVRASEKYKSKLYPSLMPEVRSDVVDGIEASVYQGTE